MAKPRTKKLSPTLAPLVVPEDASLDELFIQGIKWTEYKENWANRLRQRYEATDNPLAAWDCYSMARRKGEPVPDWVFEYFDRVAKELLKTDNDLKSVGWCLGLDLGRKDKGGHSAFKQYADYMKRREAVFQVYKELAANQDLSVEEVCEKLSDNFGVKSETIKKWYVTIDL